MVYGGTRVLQGDSLIGVAVLNGFGFTTIGQALASQVTAGT